MLYQLTRGRQSPATKMYSAQLTLSKDGLDISYNDVYFNGREPVPLGWVCNPPAAAVLTPRICGLFVQRRRCDLFLTSSTHEG